MTVRNGGRSVFEKVVQRKDDNVFTPSSEIARSCQLRFTIFTLIDSVNIQGGEILPLRLKSWKTLSVLNKGRLSVQMGSRWLCGALASSTHPILALASTEKQEQHSSRELNAVQR